MNTYSGSQSVTVSVYSHATFETEETITFVAQVDRSVQDLESDFEAFTVYAEMKKGYRPILDAKVVAIVDRPQGYEKLEFDLYDNGAGSLVFN